MFWVPRQKHPIGWSERSRLREGHEQTASENAVFNVIAAIARLFSLADNCSDDELYIDDPLAS